MKRYKKNHPDWMCGKNNPRYGKHMTEESKLKSSNSHKGNKNPSFGKHWYTNKNGERKMFKPDSVPDGWFRKTI